MLTRRELGVGAWAVASHRSIACQAGPLSVTPQSFGAHGDGRSDDGPAIRAALAAVENAGGGTVFFLPGIYRIAALERSSDPTDAHAFDGEALVIQRSNTRLAGASRATSILRFDSADAASARNWQVVNGKLWRGSGIVIKGGATSSAKTTNIAIEELTLDGGFTPTGRYTWPADPRTGDGWDVTHKGICIEPDRHVGQVQVLKSEIRRWGGELIYQGGPFGERLVVDDCLLRDTNGDGISSSMGNEVSDTVIRDVAFAGIEYSYYERPSSFRNVEITNAGAEGVSLNMSPNVQRPGLQTFEQIKLSNCRTGVMGLRLNNVRFSDLSLTDCGWRGGGYRAVQLYDDAAHACSDVRLSGLRIAVDSRDLNAAFLFWERSAMPWSNIVVADASVSRTSAAKAARHAYLALFDAAAPAANGPVHMKVDVEPGAVESAVNHAR